MSSTVIIQGVAGADLTGSRYLLVQADGGDDETIKVATVATDVENLGILQNAPADGAIADVCVFGMTKARVGAGIDIEPFDFVMFGAGAKVIKYVAAATNVCIGRYMPRVVDTNGTKSYKDAAATDLIDIFVNVRIIT